MDSSVIMQQLTQVGPEIRQRFGVKRLAVFGSIAYGNAKDVSDVDVLVEFEGPARFGPFMDLKFFLEDLLERKIDLATPNALHPRLRDRIQREAIRVA